ncbi:putative integral membrane protein [Pseudomonas sp. FH4]|jgi:sugar phosphate permease|uniref:MFS transporter n=1 Tax=Pseudomonas TaxID=286 RepID=UPI0003DB959F|nr:MULTISPECIES: MFS transporter [Pseudomonas]MDZ4305061.1 MFS transporter [Pseudomonas sp.]ETK17442.1 putative integral membrane protein [Pseudomonas sp. FH4]MBF8003176.1 MFS transporter [Pseudomonas brenneri]WJM93886.1 MFS transporter [Pseudomonas brenneri]CRM16620.1 Nicotinate degradation protein T [Pseudomonas sp. 25 R 14]
MPTVADPIHALYHKITWKLIPFLCFCYLAAYLDRINIGFAKLQMQDQLQFSETAFGLGAGLFFVGYILFEVPSNLILERVGARIWIARIMITWGLLSACTLLVTSTTQFYVLRFLLGVAEAGFLPGVLYYLTTWFPTHRRGRVIALFMIGLPLSSVIGGPLSGWIMSHFDQMGGLRGWQWLFLLEALPSVLLGVLAFWALPNTYHQAKWLSAAEKALLQEQLRADDSHASHSPRRFRDGFFNLKVWMLGGIDFSILLSAYAMGFWMPTLIRNAGISDTFHIGLLTALPSVAALAGMLLIGASSDKYRERRWHIIVPFLVGAVAMASSTFFSHNVVATVALFAVASAAILGAVPVFFSLPATFLTGTAAATGFALACSLANIAGLVSNSLMGLAIDVTGSSAGAMWFFAGSLVLSCLLVIALPAKLVNR